MAKIIYGVCGEGMGHAIRSKPIIEYLLKKHEVKIFSSGCTYNYLNKHFKDVTEIDGLFIRYKKNCVAELSTVIDNVLRSLRLWRSLKRLRKFIRRYQPDIVISDYEIITSYAAKLEHLPLISIDNQHIYSKARLGYLKRHFFGYLESLFVNKLVMPAADKYFIMTFFYPHVSHNNVELIPPVLRSALYHAKPRTGNHILVYQTSSTNERLLKILRSLDHKFIVYGFNIDRVDGNLIFRKFNESRYIKDLAGCKAIITNGGFSLIVEGLYLGKPILSIPVKRQFEQMTNAYYLERLGYGRYIPVADMKEISEFILSLKDGRYRSVSASYKKNNFIFFNHLEKSIRQML